MRTLHLALAIGLSTSAWAADAPPPAAVSGQQIVRYKAAMLRALADLGIRVHELALRGSALHVGYEDANEQDSSAFILATVVTLAAPLGPSVEEIRVSSLRGGRKLTEVAISPDSLRSVCGAGLSATEEERLKRLAADVLRDAGLSNVPASGVLRAGGARATAPAGPSSESAGEGRTTRPERQGRAATDTGVVARTLETAAPPQLPGTAATAASAETTEPVPPEPMARQERQVAERLLVALTQAKLENVSVSTNASSGWCIGFENRTYRSDIDALATCLRLAAEVLPPVQLTVAVKRDEVAVCCVSLPLGDYAAVKTGLLTPEEFARRWQVTSPPSRPAEAYQPLASGNRSRGRVDVALRPAIHYEIGNEAESFMSDEFLVANASGALGSGWRVNLQSSTRLTSGISTALDRALLTKTGWLGPNLLATGSVGKLEEAEYGWYGEIQWDRYQHRLGLVGSSVGDGLRLGSDCRSQAFGYYEYEAGELGLTVRLGYGRFVDSRSSGGLLSLQRRFGESVVAVEAIRAERGAEAVNFRLSTPLGPRVASAPSALRLRSDTAFGLRYRSDPALLGDYLQNGQDLASFRGELSAPYLRRHPGRVADERRPSPASGWPASPSLEGNSGLIRIPTAEVIPDGTLLVGASYMDEEHSRAATEKPTNAMPLFVGLGLLPGLEVVGKVTILHDVEAFGWSHNLDRSFNVQCRLLRQGRSTPAVAVGAQDVAFGTTTSYVHGEAQYAVGTWEARRYRLHLGLGRERLGGVFGGVDYALSSDHKLHLMMDYDTRFLNAGLRGFAGRRVTLDVSLLGMSDLGGAVTFRTELR